ncbi:hypothetical protein CRV24_003415 [Beauveria bassiana]|nr:hypothetical protein CRV24_003415 [Beauveria bassiana]
MALFLLSATIALGGIAASIFIPNAKALRVIIAVKFAVPVFPHTITMAESAALKSAAGFGGTGLLDCASSELEDDLDRLVLAEYLKSRETFRETALWVHNQD